MTELVFSKSDAVWSNLSEEQILEIHPLEIGGKLAKSSIIQLYVTSL